MLVSDEIRDEAKNCFAAMTDCWEIPWYFVNGLQPWVVVSNICYFHLCLGKIPILTNIFQMGWNRQPEPLYK